MKKLILFLLLSIMLLSTNAAAVITMEVETPIDVYVDNQYELKIIIKNNQTFISGKSNDTNITIKHRNGTYLMQNVQPYESNLFYILNFTANETGIYYVYATYDVYIGSGIFVSKFNLPENITNQRTDTEKIIGNEHNDRQKMSQQITYFLKEMRLDYLNLTRSVEGKTFLGRLQDAAVDNAFVVLFYVIVIVGFFIILSVVVTRPERRKIVRKFIHLPVTISKKVSEELEGEEEK